jgi:prepilin-type N-terminal cleavage/methylation domain-containing protein
MIKLNKKDGLTLIEIMITVVVLLIVLGSILYTFVHCMILNEQNGNLATANNDAQYVLEQMKALAFDNIKGYVPPALTNLGSEVISVECNSAACGSLPSGANIVQVVANVTWTERLRTRSAELSTAIARTVQ